ncbi:MAG: EAL domain-containing protein [Rheinheimera sp.]|nr:EAL domain-containing protein [Rheinheimera sp.]
MVIEKFEEHRKRRLLQVFFLTEAVLLIEVIHRLFAAETLALELSVALLLSALLLSPVWFLARRNALKLATQWLLVGLTLLVTTLLWVFNGLSDEALLGYPCILVFAALMGLRRTFLALTVLMVVNMLALGYSNDMQWLTHTPMQSSIHSALLLCLILLLLASSVWLMIGDLNQLVLALRAENSRVHQSQQQIRQLINHDALTQLPNRIVAREKFAQALQQVQQPGELVVLMFIDLDNFKHVNDSLGHHAGDLLLQAVARQLRSHLRAADLVCRISGDEFLVLAGSFHQDTEVQQLASKLLSAVATPVPLETTTFSPTCSIGVALYPRDGDNFDVLCQKADMAMYQAKAGGRNHCVFFADSMSQQTDLTFSLLNDLKKALAEQQFELYYQPQYQLSDGQISGAEALLRWHHPSRGMVPPALFIPLAEQCGLMADIGNWVLRQACLDCARWNQHCRQPVRVAVNISQTQLIRRALDQDVLAALQHSALPGALLELELTESMLVEDAAQLQQVIHHLRSAGVHFSIDDFGTGYSNLAYLQDFALELLKIDQSFTQKLLDDHRSKAVVTAIIQLAHSLNLQCVAEGVENADTLAVLQQLGCEKGQGYHWAKPEPFTAILCRLQAADPIDLPGTAGTLQKT